MEKKNNNNNQTLCPQGDDILIWEIQYNRQLKKIHGMLDRVSAKVKKIKQREI